MTSPVGRGRGGPPTGRERRQRGSGSPRHAAPKPTLAHRNRLRRFELATGHVSIDVTTELVAVGPGGSATRVVFAREGGHIYLAGPPGTAVDGWQPSACDGTTHDLSNAIHSSRAWELLRNRVTAAEAWIDAFARVDAMPPHGSWELRQFTVRWAATADFDVLASIRPHAYAGAWDVFTVLETLGARTFCSVGPHRDRRVDPTLSPCHLPAGIRIDPVFSGLGPCLTLRIDSANERQSGYPTASGVGG